MRLVVVVGEEAVVRGAQFAPRRTSVNCAAVSTPVRQSSVIVDATVVIDGAVTITPPFRPRRLVTSSRWARIERLCRSVARLTCRWVASSRSGGSKVPTAKEPSRIRCCNSSTTDRTALAITGETVPFALGVRSGRISTRREPASRSAAVVRIRALIPTSIVRTDPVAERLPDCTPPAPVFACHVRPCADYRTPGIGISPRARRTNGPFRGIAEPSHKGAYLRRSENGHRVRYARHDRMSRNSPQNQNIKTWSVCSSEIPCILSKVSFVIMSINILYIVKKVE